MPRLIVTQRAAEGIARCRIFLAERNAAAAARAGAEIARRLFALEQRPGMGRLFTSGSDLRELVIGFSRSGYVALYRHDLEQDRVVILAFRHQREAGY